MRGLVMFNRGPVVTPGQSLQSRENVALTPLRRSLDSSVACYGNQPMVRGAIQLLEKPADTSHLSSVSSSSDNVESLNMQNNNEPETERSSHSESLGPYEYQSHLGSIYDLDHARLETLDLKDPVTGALDKERCPTKSPNFIWPYKVPRLFDGKDLIGDAGIFNLAKEEMGYNQLLVGQFLNADNAKELGFTQLEKLDSLMPRYDVYIREDRIVFSNRRYQNLQQEFSPEALQWALFALDADRMNRDNNGISHFGDYFTMPGANIRGEFIQAKIEETARERDTIREIEFRVSNLSQFHYDQGKYRSSARGINSCLGPSYEHSMDDVKSFQDVALQALDFHRAQYDWPMDTRRSTST